MLTGQSDRRNFQIEIPSFQVGQGDNWSYLAQLTYCQLGLWLLSPISLSDRTLMVELENAFLCFSPVYFHSQIVEYECY